jgi:hypothetical protein
MNTSPRRTVLFLDFDGVLHPCGGVAAGVRFSRRPMFETLLQEPDLRHVEIVISSTWREAYPLRKLIAMFSKDIQPRIIGATPTLDDVAARHLRYREIRSWLNAHPEIVHWAALDDAVDDFPNDKRANVIFTNPAIGLEYDNLISLRRLLIQS